MKTAIIIHGMPSKEDYYKLNSDSESNCHWLPWIQKQLLLKDILAQTPEMPTPYNPEYDAWKKVFEQFPLNEETILIGHSCGGGFIVRYLNEHNVRVGRVVLVAPWIDLEKELETGMFDFEVDPTIVSKTNGITIFSSTNDMQSVQKSIRLLKEKVVDIKVVEFENKGHFCLKHMGTDAFPELLQAVLS